VCASRPDRSADRATPRTRPWELALAVLGLKRNTVFSFRSGFYAEPEVSIGFVGGGVALHVPGPCGQLPVHLAGHGWTRSAPQLAGRRVYHQPAASAFRSESLIRTCDSRISNRGGGGHSLRVRDDGLCICLGWVRGDTRCKSGVNRVYIRRGFGARAAIAIVVGAVGVNAGLRTPNLTPRAARAVLIYT
jgi:hypothetical protein